MMMLPMFINRQKIQKIREYTLELQFLRMVTILSKWTKLLKEFILIKLKINIDILKVN